MTDEEVTQELIRRNKAEESIIIKKLSDFVQDKIVPTDPVFYIVHCQTIDVAIEYRIKILEKENEDLKKQINQR